MFPWNRPQVPNRRDMLYAHQVADEIRQKLTVAVVLAGFGALSTGVTAALSYYARDLPSTIRTLNVSVEKLTQHVEYQTEKNRQLDETQRDIRNRIQRLEESDR